MRNLGTSFPTVKRVQVPASEEPETAVDWKIVGDEWRDEPSTPDQLTNPKFTGTWIEGPQTFDEYVMDDKGKKRLNTLLALTDPPEAPRAVMLSLDKEWCPATAHYVILVSYRRIRYKQLVDVKLPKPAITHETPAL